jgi:hypothetical protein
LVKKLAVIESEDLQTPSIEIVLSQAWKCIMLGIAEFLDSVHCLFF